MKTAPPFSDSVRSSENGEKARLVFAISGDVATSAFVLANPDRVIVDLPEVEFRLDPEVGKRQWKGFRGSSKVPGGLISSYRFGLLAPGRSRIVVDLGHPASIVSVGIVSTEVAGEGENHHKELVVELSKTDRASFLRAALAARANASSQVSNLPVKITDPPDLAAQQSGSSDTKPVIVIDPGHGGVDSGAMVNGYVEKTLVFDFAKVLQEKLQALNHFKIILTRDSDIFIPLSGRVKIGRDSGAALFISIHADTLAENSADVSGATIYTASERASDAEAARVAEQENQADAAAGLDGKEDATEVSDILFDLTRRETRTYSHVFARTLANYWKVAARLNKNPQRSAGFRVLKAPDVPSILLELGYLSNDKDGMAINSPVWQEKAATQVAQAVEAFFSTRASLGLTDPAQAR